MAVSDNLRARIRATHSLLESEGRPCGTRHIVRYLRTERPVELLPADEDAIFDAGWTTEVGRAIRGLITSVGNRTVVSAPGEEGRDYKQLSFVFLADALGVLQMYESQEGAYRVQRQGWWLICERLRDMPEGTSVADLFPTPERLDGFWQSVRGTNLWEVAA